MNESHGLSGICVELDTVAGEWVKCGENSGGIVDTVAVVPFGGRGERCVILNLPSLVADQENWAEIVQDTESKLGEDLPKIFSGSHREAFDFYKRVHEELCAWGY